MVYFKCDFKGSAGRLVSTLMAALWRAAILWHIQSQASSVSLVAKVYPAYRILRSIPALIPTAKTTYHFKERYV